MNKKTLLVIILFTTMGLISKAQDPHFSQFFISNSYVSPATLGTSVGKWKTTSTWRRQWNNVGTPFNTQAFSGEVKLLGKEKSDNVLAVGASLMLDQSMNNAFKSTYATGSVAYHAAIDKNEDGGSSKIGLGMSAMYGTRTIDYSGLIFGEQFTNGGFNIYAPTGEENLMGSKSFFTLHSGLLYSYDNGSNFSMDIGAAAYNLLKSKISFVNDPNEKLHPRYTAHMNSEFLLSESSSFSLSGLYNSQSIQSYFLVGGALGLSLNVLDERTKMLYLGAWYRQGDSYFPYVAMSIDQVQLGFSYDITHSSQKTGFQNPNSFEFSLTIKDILNRKGWIPCPSKY